MLETAGEASAVAPGELADEDCDGVISLREAFNLHAKNFDENEDGTIDSEEIIRLFGSCNILDDWLSVNKVRVYFRTLQEGYNCMSRKADTGSTAIEYTDFVDLLRWASDLKGVPFEDLVSKLVRLAHRVSDKSSSMRQKLQIVFASAAIETKDYMSWLEFAGLCKKLAIYEDDDFNIADTYMLFKRHGGDQGVDFDGFMQVLYAVGERLGINRLIFQRFAAAVESREKDDEQIRRTRQRIWHAATTVAGRDWHGLFTEMDADGSGTITWLEFYEVCRNRLHLTDRVDVVRLLFERLDCDSSDDVSIQELVDFVENAPP